ncbi:LytTR family transcriptional regulator DNA-binding domain-containing protein [Clostridium felsineum]|uniref:LytR/AlgR family response regulator transcription factor n=1 Tax=Clostridium felsineum TaxID=36839 RepID=UPI00214DD60D|nr:LytTR family DNA-binding domain-containing protein [Clostridium felsineum]MCR3758642.1 LytTR family transcriptional regulator DNA-binding domain-containing protein [Clostridium felsineum]
MSNNSKVTENHTYPIKIVASNKNKKILINVKSILYFYSDNNIINIITDNDSIYSVNHSLSFWESKLSKVNFVRCQRGYLVNIEKVIEIVPYFNSTLALKISGHNNIVPIGRKFVKNFKRLVGW